MLRLEIRTRDVTEDLTENQNKKLLEHFRSAYFLVSTSCMFSLIVAVSLGFSLVGCYTVRVLSIKVGVAALKDADLPKDLFCVVISWDGSRDLYLPMSAVTLRSIRLRLSCLLPS